MEFNERGKNDNKLLSIHDLYLSAIENKSNEYSSKNIFTYNYIINDNINLVLYYENICDEKINIYGKNRYGLNVLRKYENIVP